MIYLEPIYRTHLDDQTSEFYPPYFGINQGCPLSQFLCSILMAVIVYVCKTSFSFLYHFSVLRSVVFYPIFELNIYI